MPRASESTAWVCTLTKPGVARCPLASITRRASIPAAADGCSDQHEAIAADADCRILDHRHRGIGGERGRAADQEVERLGVTHWDGSALEIVKCSRKRRVRGSRGAPNTSRGRSLLHDRALVHIDHPVRDLARERHFMRHDDRCHSGRRQQADRIEHFAHQLGVERGGRLVEQNDRRLHRDRTRDRDALLLAAGQLVRPLVDVLAEEDLVQVLGGACARFARAEPAHLAQPDRHIVEGGEMGKQVETLEHEADAAALDRKLALGGRPSSRRRSGRGRSVGRRRPRCRRSAVRDEMMQRSKRGLAGPGGADDDDSLAAADLEVDIAQHGLGAEGLGQPFDTQRRHGRLRGHSTGIRLSIQRER